MAEAKPRGVVDLVNAIPAGAALVIEWGDLSSELQTLWSQGGGETFVVIFHGDPGKCHAYLYDLESGLEPDVFDYAGIPARVLVHTEVKGA